MSTARQFAGALAGLSQDIGAFADYSAKEQADADAENRQDRRDAANKAFQAALQQAQMQQQQSQFDASLGQRKTESTQENAYRSQQLEAEKEYRDASLQSEASYRNASLGLDKARLGIEQQNADTEKQRADNAITSAKTDRSAAYVGQQVTSAGKLLMHYQDALTKSQNAINADLTLSPEEKAAALAAKEKQYKPLIDDAQAKYAMHSKRFSQLTGEDAPSPEEAAMGGAGGATGASGVSGADGNATDEDGNPIAGLPSAADAYGPPGAAPTGTPGASTPQIPAGTQLKSMPPDGTIIYDKAGNQYVVKLGRPVPVDSL